MANEASVFVSECGEYVCRSLGGGRFEAWTKGGEIHWRDDNRIKRRADERKAMFPMVYCVGGYSAEMTGQKKGSFTLYLLHCDVNKIIEAFSGNTVLESRKIVFRRKVRNVPHWMIRGGKR